MRWLYILLAWLTLAGNAMACTIVGCGRPVVDVQRAPASGPMVVRGQLAADVTAIAPSGASGAAWEAWVKDVSPHGLSRLACANRDASHLLLAGGGKTLHVDETFLNYDRHEGIGTGPIIDVRPRPNSPTTAPSAFAAQCPPVGGNLGPYVEVVLPVGAQVFVSGCRELDRLVPCHDGADAISSALQPPTLGARRRHDWAAFAILLAVLTAGAVGPGLLLRRGGAFKH
jgi:hypothetical protein